MLTVYIPLPHTSTHQHVLPLPTNMSHHSTLTCHTPSPPTCPSIPWHFRCIWTKKCTLWKIPNFLVSKTTKFSLLSSKKKTITSLFVLRCPNLRKFPSSVVFLLSKICVLLRFGKPYFKDDPETFSLFAPFVSRSLKSFSGAEFSRAIQRESARMQTVSTCWKQNFRFQASADTVVLHSFAWKFVSWALA